MPGSWQQHASPTRFRIRLMNSAFEMTILAAGMIVPGGPKRMGDESNRHVVPGNAGRDVVPGVGTSTM